MADEASRDGDSMIPRDAKSTVIEELVVDAAEAERVVHLVQAVERRPAEMGGFEPDGLNAEAAVVATERASVLVGNEDGVTKPRVSSSPTAQRR